MGAATTAREEKVIVLDFGAQYVQLIARRIREQGVYAEIYPYSTPVEQLMREKPVGIVLSGGPDSVYENEAPRVDPRLFETGVPILGICYGHQLIAHLLGGRVEPGPQREYGHTLLTINEPDILFDGLAGTIPTWMSHGDRVVEAPPGFVALAHTEFTPVAAMADIQRRIFGVQFHPEVQHTPDGPAILRNFLFKACGCSGAWRPANFIEETIRELRETVRDGRVLCALSGGVDSAVTAALLHRAVGKQVTAMFIDHGLMRKGEPEQVKNTFSRMLGESFVAVDASDEFLAKLRGVVDPEEKRKIIGETFIRVFEREASKVGEFQYIAHGT
ncbi:MAG: glutamine-hydrolyzing GMP synthase, partial [Armatimonadetes bacterium]|nr:glutamine-hydrolyzing GMP synthase [Armatimonadota bacterium]